MHLKTLKHTIMKKKEEEMVAICGGYKNGKPKNVDKQMKKNTE